MAFVTAAKLAGFAVRICHTFDLDAFLALANGRADAVRVARALHLFARVAFTHEVGGAEFLVAVGARFAFHLFAFVFAAESLGVFLFVVGAVVV